MRICEVGRGRQRSVILRCSHQSVEAALKLVRRDEDSEQPADEAAGPRARQIELAGPIASQKRSGTAVWLGFSLEPEKNVIVPVEDGKHERCTERIAAAPIVSRPFVSLSMSGGALVIRSTAGLAFRAGLSAPEPFLIGSSECYAARARRHGLARHAGQAWLRHGNS